MQTPENELPAKKVAAPTPPPTPTPTPTPTAPQPKRAPDYCVISGERVAVRDAPSRAGRPLDVLRRGCVLRVKAHEWIKHKGITEQCAP